MNKSEAPKLDERKLALIAKAKIKQAEEMKSYDYHAVKSSLARQWPHLFGEGVYLPLEIGIDRRILRQQSGESMLLKTHIRAFLKHHCSSPQYLQAIIDGLPRRSLLPDSRAGFVSKTQKTRAQDRLDSLQKKNH